jgi:hypothetical protein
MARRFIFKIKHFYAEKRNYKMMIVNLGYAEYVMPTKDAVTILELLAKAQRYEERYVSKDDKNNTTGESYHTYHVYANDNTFGGKVLSDDKYRLASLAGKPDRP